MNPYKYQKITLNIIWYCRIPSITIKYYQIPSNNNESQWIPTNLRIPTNIYDYHQISWDNIDEYWIPSNTIEYHWIPLKRIEYHQIPLITNHRTPYNAIQFYLKPMFIPRCYIHLRTRFLFTPAAIGVKFPHIN